MNPSAVPDDGTLTHSRIAWMTRWRIFQALPRLLRATHPALDEYTVREITHIEFVSTIDEELIAQIDGEILKEKMYAISVHPQAIIFLV